MLTQQQATDFAEQWLAAWNAHDLDAIMQHYAGAITFTSPLIVAMTGNISGTITDRKDLQSYFGNALEKYTDLHFELQTVFTGVESVVLCYKSINNLLAAEVMELNDAGKVTRVMAHYLNIV